MVLPPNKICVRGIDVLMANAFVPRMIKRGMEVIVGNDGILITFPEAIPRQQAIDDVTEELGAAAREVIAESEAVSYEV